jgi:crotonobetainyl-CoA:carnitine CoA-transferase CaiB-like acyl-CoA transferase
MSHMIMGPSCGMFLGFLGAEVIKVEPPQGDKTRNLGGMGSGFFPTFNRGKKSIVLDFKSADDRKSFDLLLATADVFIENFRDKSLVKNGLDPDTLREKFPKLIIGSCKGFLHGPYEDRTAMDEVVQMMTGMAYMTGPTGRPLRIGSSANDIMGGLFCAFAVLGELFKRQTTGKGSSVRTGLFENCLLLVAQHMTQFDIEGVESPPMPERIFSWPVYDIFKTSDGVQLFVSAVTEGQWATLCTILKLEQLLNDPQLQTRLQQIDARSRTLPIFEEAISKRTKSDLSKQFEAGGIAFSPIARPAQMYDDPHVNRPDGLVKSRLPGGKIFRSPGLPIEIDNKPSVPYSADIAAIGEHTQEVLSALQPGKPHKERS